MNIANSIRAVNIITEVIATFENEILIIKPYMKNLIRLCSVLLGAGFLLTACEGPMGLAGKDANESCTQCHNSAGVDSVLTQFEFSKHAYGEAAFSESGNTGCSPCHASEAFKYMVAHNVSAAFAIIPPATTYSNLYATSADKAYGEMRCSMCHIKLHTTYTHDDFMPLTTTAEVPMTFFGGARTINLTQDGGMSNLCVKCHQPRPFTNSNTDKNVLNYAGLVSNPTAVFYDAAQSNSLNVLKPGYRTHTHYGTAGAIFAGIGGVEFGTGYTNSQHTTVASCQECHMAPMTGKAGGHTFFAKGNFNGCNVEGCHSADPISASTTSKYWKQTRDEVKLLLDNLAAKLTIGGVDILNRNGDAASNLWSGLTTNNYDGYLNIYDPINNPDGSTYNTTMFQATSTTGFTTEQKTLNSSLPKITLTNAQMGAIINFQLCLRDYSLGIHNTAYTKTLLTNSLAVLSE
jgi:hypothetical protein